MLLVYTHKITSRLSYVFKHICVRILGVEVKFTTVVEEFIAHQGLKMSYTKQPLGKELFVQSHYLLFEEGLTDVSIKIENWNATKCFFRVGEKSSIPFDIFAASFYLLSRYEEYMPYVADDFGRFPPEESLAYRYHFLKQPVVDIWAFEFKKILQSYFHDFEFTARKFQFQPIIDVPVAYKYAHKGFIRTLGGGLKDLLGLRFVDLYNRSSVLFKLRKDPFDTYKWLINNHKKRGFKPIFFFLLADYSNYDKSINHNNKHFRTLIKYVGDYFEIGLKGSFLALDDKEILKKEKLRFEKILNKPLQSSRNSFSKLKLPHSYRNLIDLGVQSDYTMGYVSEVGFRAGTCTPFYFYDLDYEMQTPLKIYPFCVLDYIFRNTEAKSALNQLQPIVNSVKEVGGVFSMVVHNYTFSGTAIWGSWRKLYVELLDFVKTD
ncbi:polysaccharide deacetylase family protein [Pseudofulvibacter geojedonensis]|uniref:Polysaccharide deacetylase family protein n=1 Tax=Pseudofulvibacter geojedonensis TaxID=1123758 RepID=A0ABW3I4U8_9FLAO